MAVRHQPSTTESSMNAIMIKAIAASVTGCALFIAYPGAAAPNPPIDASFEVTLPPDAARCPFPVTIAGE